MRLLDLFCGDGGAAMGYHRAGFDEIVGVDLGRKRAYPFTFVQGDALTFPLDGFDAVHASPPCQHYSIATAGAGRAVIDRHPDLIAPVRDRLVASGLPYVIENVLRAPLRDPLTLCGTMFDLTATDDDGHPLFLRRHRLFESNVGLTAPRPCRCVEWKRAGVYVGGVYGGGRGSRWEARNIRHGGYTPKAHVARALMGIDWMGTDSLNEAIPPAYAEHIGRQVIGSMTLTRAV